MSLSRRPLAVASLLAALGALAAWWSFGTNDPERGAPPAPPDHERTAGAVERLAANTDAVGPATDPAERTAATTDIAPPAPPAAPGVRIHGTITVSDARGVEHPECSGSLRLALLVPMADANFLEHNEQEVAVTAGKWEALAPPGAVELHVMRSELDGRPARCDDQLALTAPEQPMALRARWLEPLLVRVLADDTGADLGDVRVVQMEDWELDHCPHPGNANVTEVLAHAKSPMQIRHTSTNDQVRYWMQSPGYAWNQIALATTEPGERVLRLLPGGGVDVTLVGNMPAGAVLRVRAADGHTLVAQLRPAAAGATRIDALAEGTWSLALEKGDWFGEPLVLGRTSFTVTRGTISAAAITVRSDAETERPPSVEVRGTLRVSSKWGDDLTLELEPSRTLRAWNDDSLRIPLDEMTKEADGVHRFGPKSVLCGRYQVLVDGTEYRVLVDIGPQATEIDIRVPEPCNVRIRVLDATDDKPLANAGLSWVSSLANWDGGWSDASSREAGDGWYEFLAPPGDIEVSLHPDGYTWLMSKHVVQPGSNEFTLRIARVCGVEITLKDGAVVLPFPDDLTVLLEHVTTKSGAAYWSGNKVAAKEPGEHVLKMTTPAGYVTIEPRNVVVEPAKWSKVEVLLQRKP